MSALQRHDYKTASTAFQAVLDGFGGEGFIADRARVYQELAARELRKRHAGTGNIEERLTAATLALNNNNDDEAARLAMDVLREDRSQDLAVYLLAVIASRRGDIEGALTHLRNAISINPECRLQARQDEEFDPLMDSDDFHALIEAPTAAGGSAAAAQGRRPVRKTGR
jgi:tetratricopeptide (TPR) repeat protein